MLHQPLVGALVQGRQTLSALGRLRVTVSILFMLIMPTTSF